MECLICHNFSDTSVESGQKCANFSQIICQLYGISREFVDIFSNSTTTTVCPDCSVKCLRVEQILAQLDGIRCEIKASLIQSQHNGHFTQEREALIQEINRVNGDFDQKFINLNEKTEEETTANNNLDHDDLFPTQNQDLDQFQDEDLSVCNSGLTSITKEIQIILEPLPPFFDVISNGKINLKNEPWTSYIKRNHQIITTKLKPKWIRKSRQKIQTKNICSECNIVFKTTPEFREHNLKYHPTVLHCQLCLKSFSSLRRERSLAEHLKTHGVGEILFKCDPCNKLFSRNDKLQEHKLRVHDKIQPTQKRIRKSRKKLENVDKNRCTECNIVFKYRPELLDHNLKYHPRTLYCHQCPLSFRKERSLNEHLKVHGIGKKLFKCDICEKLFSRGAQLRDHKKHVHDKIKSFLCHYCSKVFSGKLALNRHISSIHVGIMVSCTEPDCRRTFTAEILMRKHIQIAHKREYPLSCTFCGRGFSLNTNLRDHVDHVHLKKAREMKFKCTAPDCEKTFCNSSNLKVHVIQKHSKSRDFHCTKCNKVFGLERQLRHHLLLVHLEGDSKYPCTHPQCPKKIYVKKDLQEHYLTKHADESERPIKCSICSKGFVSNYKVERHKRQVHKIGVNLE